MFFRLVIFFVLIVLIELYFLQAVRTFSQDFSPAKKTVVYWIAYILAGFSIVIGLMAFVQPPPLWSTAMRFVFAVSFMLIICKILGSSFLLIDDIVRGLRWMAGLFGSREAELAESTNGITRVKFLSQLAIAFTAVPFVGFFYGMVRGAYKYRVHRVKVPSANLPASFDGFRIIQLSDIHTGSFLDNSALTKAFDIVMGEKADLILFTGDLVNNVADETKGFEQVFAKLKAPYGVYSVLGNHDYGDYVEWESAEAKRANLNRLKQVQHEAGWRLLMNEHVALEKDGEKIALMGIENWGGKMHFPKYGRLDKAHQGTDSFPFKILLSHDPSHWEKEVSHKYKDIDLTLSGHTHGMQMGIEIPGIKWSPVKWFYRYWAGLYKMDNQHLYVNRGLGFLGYPGRLGIWPEITVLELKKA